MTAQRKNILTVVQNGLCTGCGICENVCPRQAIRMELTTQDGVYQASVNIDICRRGYECGRCYEICGGHSVATRSIAAKLFPEGNEDHLLGRILSCFTGYAVDQEIRYHGASGGVATALVSWMLHCGIIQGAVVTGFKSHAPLEPDVYIAQKPEDVYRARSSKYAPVAMTKVMRDLINMTGKYAVVGLPCHLNTIRKWANVDPRVKNKIIWHIGLFCSGTRTHGATNYLLWRLGIDPRNVISLSYRDEGCLGSMIIQLSDGRNISLPYREYYPSLRSFFIPRRCALCHDQCAELADVALGDIYIPEYWEDTVGVNSIIARSKRATTMLLQAMSENVVNLAPLDNRLLIKSQYPMLVRKKTQLPIRLRMRQIVGRAIPNYDIEYKHLGAKKRLQAFLSTIIIYAETTIGRYRKLWWIIKILNQYIKITQNKHCVHMPCTKNKTRVSWKKRCLIKKYEQSHCDACYTCDVSF